MTTKRRVGLQLDAELVAKIDEDRGLLPRAAWITLACAQALDRGVSHGMFSGHVPAAMREEIAVGLRDRTDDPSGDLTRAAVASEAAFNYGPKRVVKPIPKGKGS